MKPIKCSTCGKTIGYTDVQSARIECPSCHADELMKSVKQPKTALYDEIEAEDVDTIDILIVEEIENG